MIVVSQYVQSMLGDNPDNPEVIIELFNQRAVEFTPRMSINSFNKLLCFSIDCSYFLFQWPFRYFAITSRVSSSVRWKHQSFRFEQVGFKWHQQFEHQIQEASNFWSHWKAKNICHTLPKRYEFSNILLLFTILKKITYH